MDEQTKVGEHPTRERVPGTSIHEEDAVEQGQRGNDVERDGRSKRRTDET